MDKNSCSYLPKKIPSGCTFTCRAPCLNTRALHLIFMDDQHGKNEISLWCFAKEPGKDLLFLPPFPCRKEACERYRAEYPHCVMMSRMPRPGREYP
jgi:hypothetical protein